MESNLYKILQENFETLLKYYEIENKYIKNQYNYFIKYKEYTKEYCLKVRELFKEEINDFNYGDYEQIEINLGLNEPNAINNKSNKNKRNSIIQLFNKNIKITPIKNSPFGLLSRVYQKTGIFANTGLAVFRTNSLGNHASYASRNKRQGML